LYYRYNTNSYKYRNALTLFHITIQSVTLHGEVFKQIKYILFKLNHK
jgi:hypothetical protein